MINKVLKQLLSMPVMVLLTAIFAIAIAVATFIENDFGTEAAKTLIYNAKWFEFLLFLLLINLISNIFRFRMLSQRKWTVFLFHVAFIIILLGAAVTRFISFEGMMHIREGATSNQIMTSETYIQVKADDREQQYSYNKPLFLNPLYNPKFDHSFSFKDKKVSVESTGFYKAAEFYIEDVPDGMAMIELVTSSGNERKTQYVSEGQQIFVGQLPVAYNSESANPLAFQIFESDSGLIFKSPFDVKFLSMNDRSTGSLEKEKFHRFQSRFLYTLGKLNLVVKSYHLNGVLKARNGKGKSPVDAVSLLVKVGDDAKEVMVSGGKGFITPPTMMSLGGLNFQLGFGSRNKEVPFSLKLFDFQLERYPGSNSPASFASEVLLIDKSEGIEQPHRIYMNHVLDYRGYRFFQSSYDRDELGTVLSVNHDSWGTMITYLGYLLMAMGMFFTLFKKGTRYQGISEKLKKLKKSAGVAGLLLLLAGSTFAQDHNHTVDTSFVKNIDANHSNKLAYVLVQDHGGRIKPIHTVASELLRKVSRKEDLEGLNPVSAMLSMMVYPQYWQQKPMIKVSHPALKELLGTSSKYVSMNAMFDDGFEYKLLDKVEEINRKRASERSKFDNDVLKVDERVNILYMLYSGKMLAMFPDPESANHKWYAQNETPFGIRGEDSLFVKSIMPMYLEAVHEATATGEWAKADEVLSYIDRYQKKYGADILPSVKKVDMEVSYNKLDIFNQLYKYYGLFGMLLLILLFINIFKSSVAVRILIQIIKWIFIIGISAHTAGLGIRWFISGHAPWSNAYESMIFIAWATMIAGFIFSLKSDIALAVTGIFASLILMVAHLNWMDPEITNLVPVLNSYWLMIHVAIITASYGFLGLGALLGFINLVLISVKSKKQSQKVNRTFNELSYINELTIEVGLFLLTVGTFLGGVWANESWGRYWGWDAKETWALVTVLVYAVVLHIRFIPRLNGRITFNAAAVVAYFSVIMTYFGVNYYLSGLHSYAAGDPVPIPTFVPITVGIIFFVIILAYVRNKTDKAVKLKK